MKRFSFQVSDREAEVITRWARNMINTPKRSRNEALKNAVLVEAAHHLAAEAELAEASKLNKEEDK
jgi:hypothetical protein